MRRRSFTTGVALGMTAGLLQRCGGGGDPAPPRVVDMLGDSITSSTFNKPDGTLGRLSPTAVERINELAAGRFTAVDRSIPGMIAAEAVSGGFVFQAWGPNLPLAEVLKTSPAQTVVIRFGTADALRGIGPALFRTSMLDCIRITRAAGKTPVLVEPIIQLPPFADKADALHDVVLEVAAAEHVQLILVRDLPIVLVDRIHPIQSSADLMAARIVEQLT